MADRFNMPKLRLTMDYGKIVTWLVNDGAEVEAGQPVLLIETDKVESAVEASATGRLQHVGVSGEEYECGATIGWFLGDGETAPPPDSSGSSPTAPLKSAPQSAAPVAVIGAESGRPVANGADRSRRIGGRLLVSPNARRLAAERNLDLSTITGTGPQGRVVSEDLERAVPPPQTGDGTGHRYRSSVPCTVDVDGVTIRPGDWCGETARRSPGGRPRRGADG